MNMKLLFYSILFLLCVASFSVTFVACKEKKQIEIEQSNTVKWPGFVSETRFRRNGMNYILYSHYQGSVFVVNITKDSLDIAIMKQALERYGKQ